MDAEFDHEGDEKGDGVFEFLKLRVVLVEYFAHLFLPQLGTVKQRHFGVGLEFGDVDGYLVALLDVVVLFVKVLVKGDALSDQVVGAELEDDFDEFAGQCLAPDDHIHAGGRHTHLLLKQHELLSQFSPVLDFFLLVQDVVLVVLEDLEEKGEDLVLLLLDCPHAVDEGALQQVQDGEQSHFDLQRMNLPLLAIFHFLQSNSAVEAFEADDLSLDELHDVEELFGSFHDVAVHLVQIAVPVDPQNWVLVGTLDVGEGDESEHGLLQVDVALDSFLSHFAVLQDGHQYVQDGGLAQFLVFLSQGQRFQLLLDVIFGLRVLAVADVGEQVEVGDEVVGGLIQIDPA